MLVKSEDFFTFITGKLFDFRYISNILSHKYIQPGLFYMN